MWSSSFRFLCWEAFFAMAYDTWVGPTYLAGLAGEAGLSLSLVSALVAAPSLGAIGQLIGAYFLSQSRSTRRYTLYAAFFSRLVWVIPLLLASYWGWFAHSRDQVFPKELWFKSLITVSVLSGLLGSSGGAAWMAWMKEIIPPKFRGRFFGVRYRYVVSAMITAHLLAFLCLKWKPHGYLLGYFLVGVCAVVSALTSCYCLFRVPQTLRLNQKEENSPHERKPFVEMLIEPLKNTQFRKTILFSACFNGAMQLGGPYFAYYFTHDLGISMSTLAFWIFLSCLTAFYAAPFWGKRIDVTKSPKRVLWICAHYVSFAPIPYFLATQSGLRWVGPIEYFLNGFATTGYTIAMSTLLFEACPRKKNALYFCVNSAISGLIAATTSFVGGKLAVLLLPFGGFKLLWILTSFCRFAVLRFLYPILIADEEQKGSSTYLKMFLPRILRSFSNI
jgi:Na+/melibiose symporter-like transporter